MYDHAAILRRAHDIVRRRYAREAETGLRRRLGLGPVSYRARWRDALRSAWIEARVAATGTSLKET